MRKTLMTTAALFGLALALPAMAQTSTDPNPANPSAIKDGTPAAGTGSGNAPGTDPVNSSKTGATLGSQAPEMQPGQQGTSVPGTSNPGSVGTSSGSSPSSMSAPSSGSSSSDSTTTTPAKPRHHAMRSSTSGESDTASGGGHWAHQPGSGMSGPASAKASNIDSADTRSTIAPHLPSPKGGANASPEHYLMAAQHALKTHKTGEAQQALEMAETRLLDRSTPAGSAGQASTDPRIANVSAARKSLASKDWQGATKSIQEALNTTGSASSDMSASSGMASGSSMGGGSSSGAMQNGTNEGSTSVGSSGSMSPATNRAAMTPSVNPTGTGPDGTKAAGTGQGGGVLGTSTNDSAGGAK